MRPTTIERQAHREVVRRLIYELEVRERLIRMQYAELKVLRKQLGAALSERQQTAEVAP